MTGQHSPPARSAAASPYTRHGRWRPWLPAERFSFIELTDEKGGERLGRRPFVKGDIAIAYRGFMHPGPLAHILEQGADVIVRALWKGSRWLSGDGSPFYILAALKAADGAGVLDKPIWIGRKRAPSQALHLVALRKSPEAAEMSRAKARRAAQRGPHEGYPPGLLPPLPHPQARAGPASSPDTIQPWR